jgi:hypothetical protein
MNAADQIGRLVAVVQVAQPEVVAAEALVVSIGALLVGAAAARVAIASATAFARSAAVAVGWLARHRFMVESARHAFTFFGFRKA